MGCISIFLRPMLSWKRVRRGSPRLLGFDSGKCEQRPDWVSACRSLRSPAQF